jgi:hypothetical protein
VPQSGYNRERAGRKKRMYGPSKTSLAPFPESPVGRRA